MQSRMLMASFVCFALAACGGGGSSSSLPNPGGTPAPITGLNSQAVQQSDMQAGLSGVNAARNVVGSGTSGILVERRLVPTVRNLLAHRAAAPVSCENGTSETQTASGSATVLTLDTYYDAACTQIETSLVWTETETSTSLGGPATETFYSTSGAVTQTDQLQVTVQITSVNSNPNIAPVINGFSLLTTSMRDANGNELGEAGLACAFDPEACGVAVVANGASGETGANITATTGSSASTSLNMQVQTYHASSANALSVAAATFPDWSISPAADVTQTVSLTGSANSTLLGFTLTDSTNGGTLTINGATSGTVNGTLTATSGGAKVASFTVDENGNGSATFSNASTATIANYAIQG